MADVDSNSVVAGADALEPVVGPVGEVLRAVLDERVAQLTANDPALATLGREVRRLVQNGGKRLRPAFVYWGHRATGADHDDMLVTAGAAVELLHAFALIQDDVMDRSSRRRGEPTVHEVLAADYRAGDLRVDSERRSDRPATAAHGDPAWFGYSAAILASDLAVAWSTEVLAEAPVQPDRTDRVRRLFADLRVEVIGGQYLDLRLAGLDDATADDALRVALLKSGRYTVTRPLQLGAAIGETTDEVDRVLAVYGDAIGVAFQLRDDVLGLFGDPDRTGKSAVSDIREGKRTMLVIAALERANELQRSVLLETLGDPDVDETGADRVRQIVEETGTLAYVEDLAAERQDTARQALTTLPDPARTALGQLADLVVSRSS